MQDSKRWHKWTLRLSSLNCSPTLSGNYKGGLIDTKGNIYTTAPHSSNQDINAAKCLAHNSSRVK